MIFFDRLSTSSLVRPQAVSPWPPSTAPITVGSDDSSRMALPSSQPGRFHGTQATVPPQIFRTNLSPSDAQARAITASGCR